MNKNNYPNIKNIKAKDLKNLGFKSKAIAIKFSKLLNINIKKSSSEQAFLNELKTSLNNFKSIGLEFNETLKNIDTSTKKIKENRQIKKLKEKEFNEVKEKIEAKIKPYKIKNFGDQVLYLVRNEPTEIILKQTSDHFLQFKDFKFPKNRDYVPFEKKEHVRKKTFYLPFKYDIYNRDLSQFKNDLYKIFNEQKFTFKITFEFSFLLVLAEDKREISETLKEQYNKYNYVLQYNLFYPSTNTRLDDFKNPVVVDNKKDIDDIISKIEKEDLIVELMRDAKTSAWQFYKFLSVSFHVYEMNTPIGKINELPKHFKEGSNEKALIKYENYNDYLCFWRCIAYHIQKPNDERNINKTMKYLYKDYYNKNLNDEEIKNYKGVEFVAYDKEYDEEALDNEEYENKDDELDLIEKHFKININVYTNDNPENIQIDRRSITKYDDTLNLMRYNNHFMYIKNLNQIRHSYKCKKCTKIFTNMEACNRHEKKCDELVKHTFPGGKYNKSKSIFDKIEDVYNSLCDNEKYIMYQDFKPIVENEDDKYYPYECAFDFEAMLKKIKSNDDDKQLKIISEHVPVSVSIFSNVPGYDIKPIFLCNDKPEELINLFIKTLVEISMKAKKLNEGKYSNIIEFLNDYVNNTVNDYEIFKERNGQPEKYDDRQIKLMKYHESLVNKSTSLKSQFENWYLALPVLSFNGAKYDINLMKQYLHKSLEDNNEFVSFSIKKSNSYMSLKTQHLQFLDIRSYLAPNYSYDAFIKAYKCKLEKGFFPYDWFDNYDKINNDELPSHQFFFNRMKNKNISVEEYNICVNAWKDNDMKNFKDFLEWYNNLDVLPFIEAVEKMKTFYKAKKLDLFKDGVSLPGLVLKYLMKSTEDDFYLFDEKDKITQEDKKRNNLFYLLKDSIVGGPSIIFNRYHEANITKIRNGEKLCKKIIGYDANALYLWAISQAMPTGMHEHIKEYNLNQLKEDILNDKLFGFIQVDIETPEELKDYFSEMTPIFKNAAINFEDIGEYMQNFHTENNIKFQKGNKLIGSYFGKEILLYTPLLKWYLQHGLIINKFHCAIKYTPKQSFKKFADEVSDARRAGDVSKDYELIAETMKLFGNSAYGKTITNKENFVSTTYGNEDNISKKINSPHFKDLEELYGQKYEVTSTKREITMDLPLQIGVAVYHLAKLRMLEFYYDFIDKYINRCDFELLEMDTDSNYFAFSEDNINKLIKPELNEEYEKNKYNFLPRESEELHPTFKVDGKPFTFSKYDKRTPGLFKVETTKDKMICLCSKMYCCANNNDDKIKFSCKGIQKDGNNVNYEKFQNVLFNKYNDVVTNKGFRYVNGYMKSYEQIKKGLSYVYHKRIICDDGIRTKPLNI